MATMSTRNPYPFPKVENDEDFYGSAPQQVAAKTNSWTIYRSSQEVYGVPTHLAQQQEPWSRLNTKHTLSSSRHEVYHGDPKAPRDSLDFILKSKYNHHEELLRNRNETLFQKETFDEDQAGRKLKNRDPPVVEKIPELNHPLKINQQDRMKSAHSIKNAIAGAHSEETNNGYSRKTDGGFFVF